MQKRNSSNFSKLAFIELFGAMALTAFRLVSKPTNLLQGVLSPLPLSSLFLGNSPNSQNDVGASDHHLDEMVKESPGECPHNLRLRKVRKNWDNGRPAR